MKLLLDSRKLILAIDENIDFVTHEGMQKWKVGANTFFIDNNYSVVGSATPPISVVPNKYYFIGNEYVENKNYVGGNELEKKVTELESQMKEYKALLDGTCEAVNFLLMQ